MIFLNLRKANIFGSCILILICGGLATQVMGIESGLSVDILGPRFFPGMILAIIIALSILVIGITLKSKEGTGTIFATRSGLIHTIITLLIFVIYIVGLATVGYAISTVLFLFVLSSYFYGKIDKKMIGIAIYAVAATVVVYRYLFTYLRFVYREECRCLQFTCRIFLCLESIGIVIYHSRYDFGHHFWCTTWSYFYYGGCAFDSSYV